MPVPVRIQSASNTSVLASVTATYGATPTQNNLLLAAVSSNVGVASTAIAGWSTAVSAAVGIAGGLVLFYKIAGAAESTTVTSTATLATLMDIHIYEYSNIDGSPLGVTASTADSGLGVTARASGTTTVTANGSSLIFAAVATALGNGGLVSWSNSFNTGITTTDLMTADSIAFVNAAQTTTATWISSQRAAGIMATFLQTQGITGFRGGR